MTTWFSNPWAREWSGSGAAPATREFHRGLPGYAPTPLIELPVVARELGLGELHVKDESSRLGLPAFKILGASWACHQVMERSPGAELVTATDGNHGRAVARMARHLGTSATVFVPNAMLHRTTELIESEGAQVHRVDGDYDVAVAAAADFAAAQGDRELVQDTAWDGYEEVPGWIVEGYDTLLDEIDEELGRAPDLVVVPVGVGSLAQAVVSHYRRGGAGGSGVLAVEPDTAAALLTSLVEGEPTQVATAETAMAGLNCGTVSSLAWPVLRDGLDAAVVVTDEAALECVDQLAEWGISSGPCGAATLAGLRAALENPVRRLELALPDEAVVVLLNTEGTTQ